MSQLWAIKDGAMAIKEGIIVDVGRTKSIRKNWWSRREINATGKVVMPGFVDCHTHLIFAGSREKEFAKKIENNKEYLEILKKGGGIFETVDATRKASALLLVKKATERIKKFLEYGTTTIEVKSGYCLSCQEIDVLTNINFLKKIKKIDIVSTFLGAHVFPKDQSEDSYMEDLMWMIGEVSSKNLAEYCDVFCEYGAFSHAETDIVLRKASDCGMKIKLHAEQFHNTASVALGVNYGATSVDHLDYISDDSIIHLARSNTIGVLLPACSFHLMTNHYAPARKMIDAGVKVALATDFNPGSAPTISMQMVIALACRQMKMTPAEAITASTINSAYAIDMADKVGSLEVGKQADVIILDIPNHLQLPYWFGENLVETTIKKGEVI